MPRLTRLTPSLSALALCVASPTLADVTAADLWAEWQSQAVQQGRVLSAERVEPMAGGLILHGFAQSYEDADVLVVGRAEQLVMTETGDGSVAIQLSDSYQITVTIFAFDFSGNDPAVIELDMYHEGLEMVAGGTVEARSYDYSADLITLSEGALRGGDGPPPEVDLLMSLRDLAGSQTLNGADPDNVQMFSTSSVGSFSTGLLIAAPDGGDGQFKMTMEIQDVYSEASGSLGNLAQVAVAPDEFPEGFAFAGQSEHGALRLGMELDIPGDVFDLALSAERGSGGFDISETTLAFSTTATALDVEFAAPDVPFPIDFNMGSFDMAIDLPVDVRPEPTPFSARVAYQDILLGAPFWMVVDPGEQLVRDPITLITDITGSAQMFTSLYSAEASAGETPPGELRSLTINELLLSAGGAELTASGDMSFAAGQIVPVPVGEVDLSIVGANALMESLAAAGLVPPQQIGMVGAMTGMFMRPGATADSLESEIVFGADGSITANGMPLQ